MATKKTTRNAARKSAKQASRAVSVHSALGASILRGLDEAVAYERGELHDVRVTKRKIPTRHATAPTRQPTRPRR